MANDADSPCTSIQPLMALLTATNDITDVCKTKYLKLLGNQPPWQSSGCAVKRGQAYSLFAAGVIRWSKRHPHLFGDHRFHLWARVAPGGRAVNLSADSGTFTADASGTLELGIYMGMWADELGTLKSSERLYEALAGDIEVVVLVHDNLPAETFAALAERRIRHRMLHDEEQRLVHPYTPPRGWHYLQETGHGEFFHDHTQGGKRIIHALADNDQGILRYPVHLPLTRDTKIQWQWRVDKHPSELPENRAASHDYISIATEFNNGRDLTWIWSHSLPVETHFPCPVKIWQDRETHFVARSRDDELGRWYSESRNVYDDVSVSMGLPPTQITAVWLIVLSTFQHGVARASFAHIKLVNADKTQQIL